MKPKRKAELARRFKADCEIRANIRKCLGSE